MADNRCFSGGGKWKFHLIDYLQMLRDLLFLLRHYSPHRPPSSVSLRSPFIYDRPPIQPILKPAPISPRLNLAQFCACASFRLNNFADFITWFID
ncbi:hypothetical protein GWI33_009046 [Rhynchophorus ferrugineus]|uniref:Uncharacterized protein n=1 Tax=Rhynchophorus ferrugineus TaxID=354439 RepID=A0A834IC33_RHYFE|nr:hypothetical protein GWI33_009046 [Rhynchophorus ferrugineus]